MRDLIVLLLIGLLYLPVTILINRIQLRLFPTRKDLPAQGTIFRSAATSLILCTTGGFLLLGESPLDKLLWAVYLAIILACGLLVYVAVMCVSESGRRFYLMNLVHQAGSIRLDELKASYGKEHMLRIRLQRLCVWKVLERREERYVLKRRLAYFYSMLFYLWGRVLGFRWI